MISKSLASKSLHITFEVLLEQKESNKMCWSVLKNTLYSELMPKTISARPSFPEIISFNIFSLLLKVGEVQNFNKIHLFKEGGVSEQLRKCKIFLLAENILLWKLTCESKVLHPKFSLQACAAELLYWWSVEVDKL